MQEDQRVRTLEKDVVQLKSSIDYQSKILTEVKEILSQQNAILQNVTAIRGSLDSMRKDVDSLEKTFSDRKDATDNNNKTFSDFINKSKGALAVTLIFFGIVQGTVAFVLRDNYDNQKNVQKDLQELRVDNAVIKEKLKVFNLTGSLKNNSGNSDNPD